MKMVRLLLMIVMITMGSTMVNGCRLWQPPAPPGLPPPPPILVPGR